MKIKVGDSVVVRMNGYYREGIIHDISIGLTTTDVAGESGVQVKEYDTELNYNGSISYGNNYWAYFDQIESKDNTCLDEYIDMMIDRARGQD